MLRQYFYLPLFAGLFIFAGNDRTQSGNQLEELVNKFYSYSKEFPQQKIYIQTDKPYYISGEEMYGKFILSMKAVQTMIISEVKKFMLS